MSSVDLVVQRETDHDFSALLGGFFIGTRTFGPIVIAEIETASFREGTLEVLVGSATVPSSCSITIDAFAVARTRDDPGTLYTDAQSLATVAISADVTDATLVRAALATSFGARVAVMITASGDGFAIGSLKSTFQINLSLKNRTRSGERVLEPGRRLVHRRSEAPMAMKPRIVNVAALVHGPRPVANDVTALLSGGQQQQMANVAALLNGGKPQTIQQSNVAGLIAGSAARRSNVAALIRGPSRKPQSIKHSNVAPLVRGPIPTILRPAVTQGTPQPLTSRKSGSKPCCDDCVDAQAVGRPKLGCNSCAPTSGKSTGSSPYHATAISDGLARNSARGPARRDTGTLPTPRVYEGAGPDLSNAIPLQDYHCAIEWTVLEWKALEFVRGRLNGEDGGYLFAGDEWWRSAFPSRDERAGRTPRSCAEALDYASDADGSIPGAGATLFPDNLSGGYMLGFNNQLNALFASANPELRAGAASAFRKLQGYPGGLAASLPVTLLATYRVMNFPCASHLDPSNPALDGQLQVNLPGVAPIAYCARARVDCSICGPAGDPQCPSCCRFYYPGDPNNCIGSCCYGYR